MIGRCNKLTFTSNEDPSIFTLEVKKAINTVKMGETPGSDKIPVEAIAAHAHFRVEDQTNDICNAGFMAHGYFV